MELRGAHVLVTGASRGIGAGLAEAFAAAGARLSLVARSEAPLRALAERLGGSAHVADLADRDARTGLVAAVEAALGPLDVLVNNAGIEVAAPLDRQSPEQVADVYEVNLLAPVELCRQALPGMLARRRGHVVNVSSQAAAVAFPGITTYASSKAGLSAFTRGLAAELRGTGVGTTVVEIGTVDTDMLGRLDEPGAYRPTAAHFDRAFRLHVQRRLGVAEVAGAVVDAVRDGDAAVRLPRRGAPFSLLTAAPQRIASVLMAGLPTRE